MQSKHTLRCSKEHQKSTQKGAKTKVYKQYPPTSRTKSITGRPYASKGSKMVPKGSPKGTPNDVKNRQKIDLLRNISQRVAKGRLWAVSGYPLGAKNDVFDEISSAISNKNQMIHGRHRDIA